MRFHRSRRRNDEERVLPLINIVFLLLIFFMLAGRLEQADPFAVDPARSASEDRPDAQRLLLLIGPAGELALDGEPLTRGALIDRLAALKREADADKEIERTVWLKADRAAPADRLVAVLELLSQAGITRIEMLTTTATS